MCVEFLVLPNGKVPVEEFFSELGDKSLAKVYRLIDLLSEKGTLPFPHARKLEGYRGLWELRILTQGQAIRVFYVYHGKDKIVLVSGFTKKSQKTPERELDRAVGYLKQIGVNV